MADTTATADTHQIDRSSLLSPLQPLRHLFAVESFHGSVGLVGTSEFVHGTLSQALENAPCDVSRRVRRIKYSDRFGHIFEAHRVTHQPANQFG